MNGRSAGVAGLCSGLRLHRLGLGDRELLFRRDAVEFEPALADDLERAQDARLTPDPEAVIQRPADKGALGAECQRLDDILSRPNA